MTITIEIPDVFISGDDTMVIITGKNLEYCRISSTHYGICSKYSQVDKAKEDFLLKNCADIAESVITMIKEELI